MLPAVSALLAGQAVHDVDVGNGATVDGGQAAHAVAPLLAANVPAAQLAQVVPFRNVPAGQGAWSEPFNTTMKPEVAGMHVYEPAVLVYVPAGQATHTPAAASW